jgi:ATP-dependent metalloprotease FtsH
MLSTQRLMRSHKFYSAKKFSQSPIPRSWWLNKSIRGFMSYFLADWQDNKQPLSLAYHGGRPETNNTVFLPRIPAVDLDMVGGNIEIIELAADLVRYLQSPASFTRLGAKPPKGIILSGLPGVGKTFMAEAIAGHAGVPFISVSASECVSSYVGETERKLRKIFSDAEEIAPCIICINEIDTLGSKRFDSPSQGHENSVNSIVNQLLTLMEDILPGVIVIATTNNVATLDPALVRPGRFDRNIVVQMPNASDREQILKLHAKNKKLHHDVSLEELAALSAGFTGAKISAWMSEAAIQATRRGADSISMDDFDEARTLLIMGVKYQRKMTFSQKRVMALHEAGHAIIGHLMQKRVYKISIVPHMQGDGFTEFLPEENQYVSKQDKLDEICILLAGRAAETISRTILCSSESDFMNAKNIAYLMVTNEGMGSTLTGVTAHNDAEIILQEQMQRAISLLKKHQSEWHAVIAALIQYDELKRSDFLSVMYQRKIPSRLHHENKSRSIFLPPKSIMPESTRDKIQSLQNKTGESEISSERLPLPFFNVPPAQSPKKEKPKDLPFTPESVARALYIDRDVIRKIQMAAYCEITLQPSFKNHEHMLEVKRMLKDHDIVSRYHDGEDLGWAARLTIESKYMDDFIRYVNGNEFRYKM